MAVTNKEIERLQAQVDQLSARRGVLMNEVSELRHEQETMATDDLDKAIARHTVLVAEIAGRESVIRKMSEQIETIGRQVAVEQETEKAKQTKDLAGEIGSYLEDVHQQLIAIYGMITMPELQDMTRRHRNLVGPWGGQGFDHRQAEIKQGIERILAPRYKLTTKGWVPLG